MLVGAELHYPPIEKVCLALVFAVKKMRHYFLSHKVQLISKADPLKFLMFRPVLSGRLAKWSLMLMEFDITYVSKKAIKGQALADFLPYNIRGIRRPMIPHCQPTPQTKRRFL